MHSMAALLSCLIDRSLVRRFFMMARAEPLLLDSNSDGDARSKSNRARSYPNVNFAKIAAARLNALSTAAAGVIPFLMTSACALPQSCSALT